MSAAVGQTAASAQDVRAQQAGQPTAAEAATGGATGATGTQGAAAQGAATAGAQPAAGAQAAAPVDVGTQIAILAKRGQIYAQMGNEAACLNLLEQARALTQ
jgi:hypothetical protein